MSDREYTLLIDKEGTPEFLIHYDIKDNGENVTKFGDIREKLVVGNKRVMDYIRKDLLAKEKLNTHLHEVIEVEDDTELFVIKKFNDDEAKFLSVNSYEDDNSLKSQYRFTNSLDNIKFYTKHNEAKEVNNRLNKKHFDTRIEQVNPKQLNRMIEQLKQSNTKSSFHIKGFEKVIISQPTEDTQE